MWRPHHKYLSICSLYLFTIMHKNTTMSVFFFLLFFRVFRLRGAENILQIKQPKDKN